ncbi:coiled-coil domain-containing protein [Peribacillus butanolivorans]|uniref:coiled-coil domain-containing protein n=1 Tax=Peribacillus butanolivorans TaxID=421767 RepID=UPI0037C9C9AF
MEKNSRKKMSLKTLYTSSFGAFILGFCIIFISPMLSGGSYKFEEAQINEYMTLSNSLQIALVKKEYNSEKQFMRMDFSVKESTNEAFISDIKYEINSRYIKDDRKQLKTEVTQINDNYFVVVIKDIPKGFSVLSTTIVPEYVHPELQQYDDLGERSVKLYINESEKIVNKQLKKSNEREFKIEYITFQQNDLKDEITLNEKEIETKKLAIDEIKKEISELESDMQYQTEEEKFETKNNINSYKTTIQTHQNDIDIFVQKVEGLNKKIKLLEEKRASL